MECAHCKKPAIKVCKGCTDIPPLKGEILNLPRYCNVECQRAHWEDHKDICHRFQDRKRLYRVIGIAQKLCYIYLEIVWPTLFELHEVKKVGEDLLLWSLKYPHQLPTRLSEPFPHHLVTGERDFQSVLTHMGIVEDEWYVEFMDGLLKGIVKETKIIKHTTKNDKRGIWNFAPGYDISNEYLLPGGVPQQVINAKLRSGEEFAIDMMGARCGYYDPIWEWKEYEEIRIDKSKGTSTSPLSLQWNSALRLKDFSADRIRQVEESLRNRDFVKNPANYGVCMDLLLPIFNLDRLRWQAQTGCSIKDAVWKLSESEFVVKEVDLVDYVHHSRGKDPFWYTSRGKRLVQDVPGDWLHYQSLADIKS